MNDLHFMLSSWVQQTRFKAVICIHLRGPRTTFERLQEAGAEHAGCGSWAPFRRGRRLSSCATAPSPVGQSGNWLF